MKIHTTDEIRSMIRERHSLASDKEICVKHIPMEVKADDDDEYLVRARITAATVDLDLELIQSSGVNTVRFEKTGAIFWNHDYNLPVAKPVGKMVRSANAIEARAMFAKRPADFTGDFFPDYVRALVKQGVVKGVSIGFIPIESRPATQRDREQYGENVTRILSKIELLEWSFAPIQSNTDAMVIDAVGKGIITRTIAKSLFDIDVPESLPEPAPEEQVPVGKAIHQTLPEEAPQVKRVHHVILGEPPMSKSRIKTLVTAVIAKKRGRLYPTVPLTDDESDLVRSI